jgi:surfeit locus 1 family protein
VQGTIRRSQSKPDFGQRADSIPAPGEEPLRLWYFANVEGIGKQLPYRVLVAYIQRAPDPNQQGLPFSSLPELDLTEGPHMSYALQWFSFAAVLLFGYPFFIRKRERVR